MENIDYTEKIATFNLLVGNNNEEIALNYLTLTNWDETKAAVLYNQENKGSQAKYQSKIRIPPSNDNYKNTYNNNNLPNNYREPRIRKEYININLAKLNKYEQCAIYKPKLYHIFKIFKIDNRGYCPAFQKINGNCLKNYDIFINTLRNKVGVILLYNQSTYNETVNIFKILAQKDVTKDLLNSKTVIIPLISGSLEGDLTIKELKVKNFPCIIICFYKNDTHFAVIGKINNIKENIQLLNDKLLEAHDLFNDKTNKNNTNDINNNIINNNNSTKQNLIDDINNLAPEDINKLNNRDSYGHMTDGEVLAKQEREMKSLEKMAENQKLEEQKKEQEKLEEEKKKEEQQLKEKMELKSLLESLPEEPSDDNPDKSVIVFRFPDGEKTAQRKFLKTDNISLLYLYVKSFGREIYSESEDKNFSLIQTFPFKNFDELQNNTLEKEGLFPNAVLQIRVIEENN